MNIQYEFIKNDKCNCQGMIKILKVKRFLIKMRKEFIQGILKIVRMSKKTSEYFSKGKYTKYGKLKRFNLCLLPTVHTLSSSCKSPDAIFFVFEVPRF